MTDFEMGKSCQVHPASVVSLCVKMFTARNLILMKTNEEILRFLLSKKKKVKNKIKKLLRITKCLQANYTLRVKSLCFLFEDISFI